MNKTPKTFSEIFDLEVSESVTIKKIEIPIIQRDYAQGRETKEVKRIRKQFIKVLHGALIGEIEPVKLDFVYGNITDGKLIPLDGQQRLTTLFLLHWYIAKKEGVSKNAYQFLSHFTYRTRFSSSHFCKNLVESEPDFSGSILSEWITDQSWYMYSWDYDPTIRSMLVMLDEIHSVFHKSEDLWDKLCNAEESIISFYFLPLEEMGLTDSLYIKMNSRGKPLTIFEHFKADFEEVIKGVSEALRREFVTKVDNDWVDMLWKYKGDDNVIDDEFMRYFRYVTEMLCYQQELEIEEDDFDLAHQVYGQQNANAEDNLRFLFKAFDCWKAVGNIDLFFSSIFAPDAYESGKVVLYSHATNLFLECCNKYGKWIDRRRAFALNSTLLLYACLRYQMNQEQIDESVFKERLRIVRNLVQNSPDEIRAERMKALLNDTEGIIVKGEISLKGSGYNVTQKEQEQNKIVWREQHTELIDVINRLEDHSLLQGGVAIIGLEDSDKFANRVDNFYSLFNGQFNYLKIGKALLAIDDYSQLASWRFLFGNKDASSWRELFIQSKRRQHFERTRATLLKLLDSIDGDYDSYLEKVAKDFISAPTTAKDWRYYFVKYPTMREGKSGVYWWRNDSAHIKENPYEVFMMNTPKSLNGRHWDPYLYTVYSDIELQHYLSLEDYGAALVFNMKGVLFKCFNRHWEVVDRSDNFIQKIEIPQEEGIDQVDRIELLKEFIKTELNHGRI